MDEQELFGQIYGGDGSAPQPAQGLSPLQALLAVLASSMLGGGTPVPRGDDVAHHDGPQIILPKGMTYEQAQQILERRQQEAQTQTTFERRYRYRPDDGAFAAAKVLRERYGVVFGEEVDMGMFGTKPPETRSVTIGLGQTVQVPWGRISVPTLEGVEMTLCDRHHDSEYGPIFDIHALAPLKYKDEINAFFDAVEQELRANSIYRGKAIVGTDRPEFLDLDAFRADEIVFSGPVTETLEGTVWAPLRYTEAFRQEGVRLKRTALLYGPYGTGKSSAGLLTAQIAVEHGWTFVSARPGKDRIEDVLRLARLYMPAVVFIEDVDGETSSAEDDAVARLLEAFDGITAKGGELVVIMTTNHADRIHRGMLRPGRLDAVIEVAGLDRGGIERLIRAIVPAGKLADNIDFDAVYAAMDGFLPAFVREALERAKTFAIARLRGARNYVLSTEDLVAAARSLHPQLQMLQAAKEGESPSALVSALGDTMRAAAQQAVHGAVLRRDPATDAPTLTVPGLNGQRPEEG